MLELMINDEIVTVDSARADTMLLPFLREHCDLTGTKEGCASGDCGACTVVIVESDPQHGLVHKNINACITPLYALHGKQVITVEYLRQPKQLHPVQQAVVDAHGSQCGFCTPGFVMSMYALSKQPDTVENPIGYLGGNLCRCTGYGPLIEAAKKIQQHSGDPIAEREPQVSQWIDSVSQLQASHYIAPQDRLQLAKARAQLPDAPFIAGGTDLSLIVTQQLQDIPALIDVSQVKELNTLERNESYLTLGAAVPLYKVHQAMKSLFPSTDELFDRLGSLAIRHRGTLGGSLAHASPIGDVAPLLISLNAEITLDNGQQRRSLAVEDFITDYRQTALRADEWIESIDIPYLSAKDRHAMYKISKRFEDDISTLTLGILIRPDTSGTIRECRISAGGIAAKTRRLTEIESLFIGQRLERPLIDQVKQQIASVINPLSDVRASADYRIKTMANLFERFYLEQQQIETRVVHYA
ncbi:MULTISPECIES: xanthine dehydrogenase small subunit [unclassified Vibrio]|uniref:Xanthine dehydrogenase small subunit n=1 Tax=Vibrio sp. HB236076 TaxID=3232307 RepID=A0AB39HE57_9VIBR|nr:xanthine dehydrogenase small subunit [Vibrio sp. HB161653]MDP5252846.1 xanthine dehydrogenase small subunit [Vibrio sp. HB161653]